LGDQQRYDDKCNLRENKGLIDKHGMGRNRRTYGNQTQHLLMVVADKCQRRSRSLPEGSWSSVCQFFRRSARQDKNPVKRRGWTKGTDPHEGAITRQVLNSYGGIAVLTAIPSDDAMLLTFVRKRYVSNVSTGTEARVWNDYLLTFWPGRTKLLSGARPIVTTGSDFQKSSLLRAVLHG
jgi:hypothetical protein